MGSTPGLSQKISGIHFIKVLSYTELHRLGINQILPSQVMKTMTALLVSKSAGHMLL